MRVQRTRSLASLGRSPLTRGPLGGTDNRPRLVAGTLLVLLGEIYCSARVHYQNLVVWNQTQGIERIRIEVDDRVIYSGQLGTVDYAPAIVIHQQLGFPDGQHLLTVNVPARNFKKSVPFTVSKKPVNLHVMLNPENIEVNVSYGDEAYL
jgi:hypothetical protein